MHFFLQPYPVISHASKCSYYMHIKMHIFYPGKSNLMLKVFFIMGLFDLFKKFLIQSLEILLHIYKKFIKI